MTKRKLGNKIVKAYVSKGNQILGSIGTPSVVRLQAYATKHLIVE